MKIPGVTSDNSIITLDYDDINNKLTSSLWYHDDTKNRVYLRAVGLFVCMDPSAAMKL